MSPFSKLRNVLAVPAAQTKLGRLLDPLRLEEYQVLHDVDLIRDVVPHVVVGPSGIYAIVGRSWRGKVHLGDGGKLSHGALSGEAGKRHVLDKATSVRRRLAACGLDHFVLGVIALTTGRLQRPIDLRTMHVVDATKIAPWIKRRRTRLQRREIDDITVALEPHAGNITRPIG
jgi:hypothetical protein